MSRLVTTGSLSAFALLTAWLGAAALLALAVAPAAFAVLPSRALAGAVVGRVLPIVFWSGMVIGALALALTWTLPARTPRVGSLILLIGACAVAQLAVAPRIERVRAAIGGPVESLDASDPQRQLFGRLHAYSVAWMGIAGVAALITLVLLTRSISSRSTV